MCDTLDKKISRTKAISEPAKEVLKMVVKEFKKVNTRMDGIENRLDKVENRMGNIEERIGSVEKTNTQILEMVNTINNKLSDNQIETKAAQMDLVHKLFTTKVGWIVLILIVAAFVCAGVAIPYFLEHSNDVATVASALK